MLLLSVVKIAEFADMAKAKRSIGELEDKLRQAKDRIAELRRHLDEAEALVTEAREHVEDVDAILEAWIASFDMVQGDDGLWRWSPFLEGHHRLREAYDSLVKKWNKVIPIFKAKIRPRGVGRPLQASEAQCVQVLKLRK